MGSLNLSHNRGEISTEKDKGTPGSVSTNEITRQFAIGGMTCGSCVGHVEAAIGAVPGVQAVKVDLNKAKATVSYLPASSIREKMALAVSTAGYTFMEEASGEDSSQFQPERYVRSAGFGLLATAALLAFYLGIITLAQGWSHALEQLAEDKWFIGVITAGFGLQVGLFTYLRTLHQHASKGAIAASTSTSATAMLACCAHHLADILPVVGLSGAAVFLNTYKTPLLWLGIVMNLGGIVYMLLKIRQQRQHACQV